MKTGILVGAIPEKVLVKPLAIVTAGLAKEVEDVNQYPAVMNKPTAYGTASGRVLRQPNMVTTKPNVATNSPIHCPLPLRIVVDGSKSGLSNMACAIITPRIPPII
ncbi:uncharacterized protein METZ01_LOCUS60141 [marine metagenome]|uniref:Uncharacterized protein n=1 Tax=marine metagenome TaxID=408172 RepID=A0A381SY23_9ZZZZ